ncbi:MAG: type II secretion system protein N, partial [Gammaproteobacteria bacterium]
LSDASLNWPQTAVLGSYQMRLHTSQDITGDIQDSGGPLALQARAVLRPNGAYSVTGKLSARDINSAAAQLLTYLGAPDASGKYAIDFGGHL